MPTVDGQVLTGLIRQTRRHDTLPIVVLSTCVKNEERMRCFRAGANAFLPKPATMHDVRDLVRLISRVWLWDWQPLWYGMNSQFLYP